MKKNNLTLNGYMSIKFASTLREGVDCLLAACIDAGAPFEVMNALNTAASELDSVVFEFRKACGSFDGINNKS